MDLMRSVILSNYNNKKCTRIRELWKFLIKRDTSTGPVKSKQLHLGARIEILLSKLRGSIKRKDYRYDMF